MSIVEFKQPEWMDGVTARSIEQKMKANLPSDIDKTEGGFAWDMTYPSALEKAEMIQFYIQQTLRTMFHIWAEGEWLDHHATENGLVRRPANKAYGYVTVTGIAGTKIAEGFVFAVPSDGGVPAIEYETLAYAEIPESGTIDIAIQALEAGEGSNVDNDTVTIMRTPLKGITKITNAERITGGAETESDDDLRQRIDDVIAGRNASFVGNNRDYVRWAKEVPGVGYAHTIPEYNGPNSVKVVVVDMQGQPANEQICQNVFTHIFGESRDDIARLAPVGLIDFAVVPPEPVVINYSFSVKLKDAVSASTVASRFKAAIADYYEEAANEIKEEGNPSIVKYVKAHAVLADDVEGVADFKDFKMNGCEENVKFHEDEYPVTGKVEVTAYE